MEAQFIQSGEHKIAYFVSGNPDARHTVVSLHGGPGSKSKPTRLKYFDLNEVRVVQIDQRGCGQSTAPDILTDNTTQDLIKDMELVREELGLEKWLVWGGSWGATLALVYAQTHPNRVTALGLRSIFFAREQDTQWVFGKNGAALMAPDIYGDFHDLMQEQGGNVMQTLKYCYNKVKGDDTAAAAEHAALVLGLESNLMKVGTAPETPDADDYTDEDEIRSAQVYLHYMTNNFFLEDDQIMNGLELIKNIPTVIIHGRYDILCPFGYTWQLAGKLNKCRLIAAESSGHSTTDEADKLSAEAFGRLLAGV